MEEAGIEYHHLFNVVTNIRKWLQRDWNLTLVHVFREANFGADKLAKMGSANDVWLHVMEESPASMEHILLADVLEVPSVHV